MKFLAFDTETSGLNEKTHSILTAYFEVYDENWKLLDSLDLYLKPDSGDIVAEAQALAVTGINIADHLKNPKTVTMSEGSKKLAALLQKHKIKGKRKHYRPFGQNITFDLRFIFAQLMSQEEWEGTVHYRPIDTLYITTFLQDIGYLPDDLGNLTSLVEHFNVPKGEAHNAQQDVKMTVSVYQAMKKMMKDKKTSILGISNHELLNIVEME